MIRTNIPAAAAALALALCACGGTPEGPVGPNGGPNRLRIVVDGVEEGLDTVSLSVTESSSTSVTLSFSGGVDPIRNAVDDEYGYVLRMKLDRAALEALAAPTSIDVKGSLQYTAFGIDEVPPQWTNDPAGDSLVQFAMLHRTCFCADPDGGDQTIEGTFLVDAVDADSVTGRLQIRVTGDVPNMGEPQDISFEIDLDLSLGVKIAS